MEDKVTMVTGKKIDKTMNEKLMIKNQNKEKYKCCQIMNNRKHIQNQ